MHFLCPHCSHEQDVPAKDAGKTVKCPKCKGKVRIGDTQPRDENRYSLEAFVRKTAQTDKGQGHFEMETDRLLEIDLKGSVWTKMGSMVAWSGSLQPGLKTDVSFKTFLGRGSGESIQMKLQGDGFVVVQPYEEV